MTQHPSRVRATPEGGEGSERTSEGGQVPPRPPHEANPLHTTRAESFVRASQGLVRHVKHGVRATILLSHLGTTVASMSPLISAGRHRVLAAAGQLEGAHNTAGEFFHNPSITSRAPRDARSSHQVGREVPAFQPFLHSRGLSPVGSIPNLAVYSLITSPACETIGTPVAPRPVGPDDGPSQPFQGGGTGSNPVGGAQG